MTAFARLFETLPQHPALEDERFADAFAPDATVDHPELGPELWAIRRRGATVQVLYVHNATDEPQSFKPVEVFGGGAAPLFLGGEINTAGEEGPGLICRLGPHSHVWLARTGAPSKEDT